MNTGVVELDLAMESLASAKDRDEHHELLCKLAPIAAKNICQIFNSFSAKDFPKFDVVSSLRGQTSNDAIKLFCLAITDENKYVRWAAAEALSICSGTTVENALIAALDDRAKLVKGVAVSAMKVLKPAAAIPQLTKIAKSQWLLKTSPAIVEAAQDAIRVIAVNDQEE